ncbi:MAG: hypothetical protein K5920_03765 [Bacteroidales bacterium]|nr:hypothetical protein [Bacteroidales bacterium]
MKDFSQVIKSKWMLGALFIMGLLFVIGPIYYSFKRAIWLDPAIIMTEMESVAKGYIPYKTMHLNYPPLFFYMMAGLKKLFGVPYGFYNFYLSVNYLFLFGCAFCLDVIARQLTEKKWFSDFSALLFVMVMLALGADGVMFEVSSMFFGLLSCMLCLLFRNKHPFHFLYIGMIAACSFLVKQFGAGYFALVGYLIFCFCECWKWRRALLFGLGYIVPIIIVLYLFGSEFVVSTLLNGYGTTTSALKGEDVSIMAKLLIIFENSGQSIVHSFMVMVSAFILLPMFYKQRKWKEILFCFFGFAGFCLQFYFCNSSSLHYRQYMAPFAILMIPLMLALDYKKKPIAKLICIAGLLITLYQPVENCFRFSVKLPMRHYCETGREGQLKQAMKLREYIDEGSTIWIANSAWMHLYYFSDLPTPNMKQVGFSAGPWELTVESAKLQIESADYVLCTETDGFIEDNDYYLNPFRQYLEGFHCDTVMNNMLLYNMRRPIAKTDDGFCYEKC